VKGVHRLGDGSLRLPKPPVVSESSTAAIASSPSSSDSSTSDSSTSSSPSTSDSSTSSSPSTSSISDSPPTKRLKQSAKATASATEVATDVASATEASDVAERLPSLSKWMKDLAKQNEDAKQLLKKRDGLQKRYLCAKKNDRERLPIFVLEVKDIHAQLTAIRDRSISSLATSSTVDIDNMEKAP
jgi:hypothetical protein